MKTNLFIYKSFNKGYIFIFVCLLSISSLAAPPDYDFRNPVLISGTDLQMNAKYRFSNVKTGVDAIVTIVSFSGGATLSKIDGPTGYVEAFQPVISLPANSNGYVEFRIEFVTAGTSTSLVMTQITSTSLDIDGTLSAANGNLFEYDLVSLNSASSVYNFDMSSTELSVNSGGGWVTGTNANGNNYSGVDTAAKNVMFTVINYNSTSFMVRMGTDNRSTSAATRNKSIYFANFAYANGLLSKNPLLRFSGTFNNAKVSLEWQIDKSAEIQNIFVERSISGNQFTPIQVFNLSTVNHKTNFQHSDYTEAYDKVYYRLKIVQINGLVNFSEVMIFLSPSKSPAFMIKTYFEGSAATPSVIFNSPVKAHGTLMFCDMAGNIKFKTDVSIHEGKNRIRVNQGGLLKKGYHVAILQIGNKIYTNKFLATTLY